MRICGGPLGSQRKTELSSLPATALFPDRGFAESNLACPQDVKGGRKCSFTPFMPGVPGTSPSRYCIQTPDRSWDRGAAASCEVAVWEGLSAWALAWANPIGEKRSTVAT